MSTLLVDKNNRKIFKHVTPDEAVHTHAGIIRGKDINKADGTVKTNTGHEFDVYEASFLEKVESMKMGSRPIYPYDSGIMSALLSIKEEKKVLEAGTGSGGNTIYMAELGAVIDTFEKEQRFYEIAEKNLSRFKNVKMHNENILEAKLKENYYDVVFLDLQNPADAVEKTFLSLKKGGFIGVYSPIMDDIKPVWRKMEELGFMDIRAVQLDLKELIVKKYARVKGLLGFPGFFIWARKR